jgi:TRAP-type C4-dicarboxylate transport system permease small subunit
MSARNARTGVASRTPEAMLNLLARIPDIAAAALLATITALVVAQVVVRYLLGGSLVWSEELTRLLFVWMVLVAAARAEPMRIDQLLDALPARLAAFIRLLGTCLVAALTGYLVVGAWGMMDLTEFDTYIALGISVRWLYCALFVAGLLWLIRAAADILRHARAILA